MSKEKFDGARVVNWYSEDICANPKMILSAFFDVAKGQDIFQYFKRENTFSRGYPIGQSLLKMREHINFPGKEISFLNEDGSVKKGKEDVCRRNLQTLANDYYLLEGLDELFTKFKAQREYTKLVDYIDQKADQTTQNKLFSLLKDSQGSTEVKYLQDKERNWWAGVAGYGVKLEGDFKDIKSLLEEKELKKSEPQIKGEVFAQIYQVYEKSSDWRKEGVPREKYITDARIKRRNENYPDINRFDRGQHTLAGAYTNRLAPPVSLVNGDLSHSLLQ